jgi:outer membrane biogenesis lipoprotein LolB
MKRLFIGLVFLFLQGCETLNIQQHNASVGTTPDAWSAKGRVSIIVENTHQNLGFEIEFLEQVFKLSLTDALGLAQVNVHSSKQGLLINQLPTELSLQQWMKQKLGSDIPLDSLSSIIFKHQLNTNHEWQMKISRFMPYQEASVAKLVKLQHRYKPIKIKLLFQEVNQLK